MKILVADDERELSNAICAVLKATGHEVTAVYNGKEAVEAVQRDTFDACVFDIMMPVMDGITALKTIREAGVTTPVIMLTAKAEIDDRITGLDSGADDYLTKPFAMKELLARLRAFQRRTEGYTPHTLTVGRVTLKIDEQELSSDNSIRLGGRETKLLSYLMLNRDKKLSTENIFEHIWGDEKELGTDVVWIYINYLRNKLISINADISIEGEKDGEFTLRIS